MEVNYILPNFFCLGRNEILINIYKKRRNIMRDNIRIYSFYGTFPKATWNGGRVDNREQKVSKKYMKRIRDFYNKNGIVITFTFTNILLTEEHLKDEYCNEILKVFHNGKNEVLVASELLENYIKQNYPKYKINRSITANHDEEYNYDKYNMVVIDKKYNRDYEYLKIIKKKEKVELLCDEVCFNDCKFTKQHYKEISDLQLGAMPKHELYGRCRYQDRLPSCKYIQDRNKNSKYYISPNDVSNIYAMMGFKYFKLSGREKYNFIGLESIIDYLIKPEYQMDVRTYIMERILLEAEEDINKQLAIEKEYSMQIDNRGYKYV